MLALGQAGLILGRLHGGIGHRNMRLLEGQRGDLADQSEASETHGLALVILLLAHAVLHCRKIIGAARIAGLPLIQRALADADDGEGPVLTGHLGGDGLGDGQSAAAAIAHILQLNSAFLFGAVEVDDMERKILARIVRVGINLEIGDVGHGAAGALQGDVTGQVDTGAQHGIPRLAVGLHAGHVQHQALAALEGIAAVHAAVILHLGSGLALEGNIPQCGAALEGQLAHLGNSGGDGQRRQRGVLGKHAGGDLRHAGGQGDAGQLGVAAQSGSTEGEVLCLKDDLLQIPCAGHIAAHIVEASGLHVGNGGGHGDLGDLGQRLGIGVAVVAAAVEGVRRHSGDGIGHAILGIGAGQSDLAAQAGLIVADDGRGLGVLVKHLVVEHPSLAAVRLCAADAKAAGIGMRFAGNDLGAALILAHGAMGAVTVVGVHPVVADRHIRGILQTIADRTENREIVAHLILVVAEIGTLAVDNHTGRHIISGISQISRNIAIEIQAVQTVAVVEGVIVHIGNRAGDDHVFDVLAHKRGLADLGNSHATNGGGNDHVGITADIIRDLAVAEREGVCRRRLRRLSRRTEPNRRRHHHCLRHHHQAQQQRRQPPQRIFNSHRVVSFLLHFCSLFPAGNNDV